MGPINYGGLQSPNNVIQQAMSGYKMGAGLRADKQAQQAQIQQQQQARAMQADLASLANNPNAGAKDYSNLMVRHPALREHLTKSYEFLDKDAQANNLKFASELYASIYTGNTDVAKGMLERRKEAAKNSGDDKEFASASAIEKILDANPNAAKTTMGLVLAGISGDDTFATIQEKLENVKKTRAETKTIDATRDADVDVVASEAEQNRAKAGESEAAAELSKAKTETVEATRAADIDTIVAQAMQRRSAGEASLAAGRKSDAEGLRVAALLGGQLDQQLLDQGLTSAEIAKVKAEAQQEQAGTAKIEVETDEVKALTPLKVGKYQAEVEDIQGKTKERNALLSGQLDQQLLDQGKTKADITKLKVEAKKAQNAADKTLVEIAALKRKETGAPELSAGTEKLLNKSVEDSIKFGHLADQYEQAATQIRDEIKSSGLTGKSVELVKKYWGSEDKITGLRQTYRRLRNTQALEMLPPGVASDKDIEIAMGAFPEDTANPELIASFMEGMSKLQRYDSAVNSAKGEWIGSVGNLGTSRRAVNVGGVIVPAGIRFSDYAKTQTQYEQIKQNRKAKNLPPLTSAQYQDFMTDAMPKKKVSSEPKQVFTGRVREYPDGTVKKGGSKAWRNNNPGNITAMSGVKYGAIGRATSSTGDKGDQNQLVFKSREDGVKAFDQLIKSNYSKGPIKDEFKKYQTSKSGYNGKMAAMKKAGININDNIGALSRDQYKKFRDIMFRFEGWVEGES